MASKLVRDLRHPKEQLYGVVMTIFGAILWVFFALVLIGEFMSKPEDGFSTLTYIVFFIIFALVSAAFYRAHAYGHFVLLGRRQFPDLHSLVETGAAQIGLQPAPTTFLYNSNGLVNAFARRLLGGRFVFLTSALVEMSTDAQVKFVVGHELGHHAAGHLDWGKNLIKLPAYLVPFLAPAYSRGRELTCDRVGAYLSNDRDAARSALAMLACGCRRLNTGLNCDAFEDQDRLVPGLSGWLTLILSHYPRTTQRVIAISDYFRYVAPQIEDHR